MMKITAGLGSADEYIRFVEAGADEFFSGFVPYSWTEKYGTVMPLNRREVLCYHVQLGAFSELEILSEMIQKYKKPVHLTFNSLYYIPQGISCVMPARDISAATSAIATPEAFRFWHGYSTRPPTGSHTSPSMFISTVEAA